MLTWLKIGSFPKVEKVVLRALKSLTWLKIGSFPKVEKVVLRALKSLL